MTSVGATELSEFKILKSDNIPACKLFSCVGGGVEVATSNKITGFTSGGGFSKYNKQLIHQKILINNYLSNTKLPPSTYYNINGRG